MKVQYFIPDIEIPMIQSLGYPWMVIISPRNARIGARQTREIIKKKVS
jgi:hypothetical protein